MLGLSIIPFFLFLPMHAPDKSQVLWVAAVLGVGSALALTGIGLTPYDIYFRAHHTALFFWVVSLVATVILHCWALFTSEECSTVLALPSLGLAAVIVLYLFQGLEFFLASMLRSPSSDFAGFVTTQKYVVLAAVAWYLVFGARMVCTTEFSSSEPDLALEWTAEERLRRLHQGGP